MHQAYRRLLLLSRYALDTFAYVSTVIPAAWDGTSVHATKVTSTAQTVTVSRFRSTITKFATPTQAVVRNGTTSHASPKPVYLTVAKDFMVAYNQIGPLAIPGYGGSGLCKECNLQQDGSRSQVVNVIECRSGPVGTKCMGYTETWISKPAAASSSKTVTPLATRFVAPSAGTYTFTFTLTAPSHIITAGVETITVAPSPYFHQVIRECHRPREVVDFTVLVTKTIYWTVPCSKQPPRTSSAVPIPTGSHEIPGFREPGKGPSSSLNDLGGDPYDWADWGSDDVTNPSLPLPQDWADWTSIYSQSATRTESSSVLPSSSSSSTSNSAINSYTMSSSTDINSGTSTASSFSTSSASPISVATSSSPSSGLPQSSVTTTSPINTSSAATTGEVTSSLSSGASGPSATSSVSTMVNTSSFSGGPVPGSTSTLTSSSSSSTSPISISASTSGPMSASGSISTPSPSSSSTIASSASATSSPTNASFSGGPIPGSTSSTASQTTSALGTSSTTSSFGAGPIAGSTTSSSKPVPSSPISSSSSSTQNVFTTSLSTTSQLTVTSTTGSGSSSSVSDLETSQSTSSISTTGTVPGSTTASSSFSSISSQSRSSTNSELSTPTSSSSSTSIVPFNFSLWHQLQPPQYHINVYDAYFDLNCCCINWIGRKLLGLFVVSDDALYRFDFCIYEHLTNRPYPFIHNNRHTNSPLRIRKRALQYLGFSDGTSSLFSDSAAAAQFFLDTAGYLRVGSFYVDADFSQPYITLSLITAINDNLSKWSIDANGILMLQAEGSSFCTNEQGIVSQPHQIRCYKQQHNLDILHDFASRIIIDLCQDSVNN
ncbi:hypothetical protein CLAIMM_09376 [Cladophialophora immunda]|nr:hypothetical protein CLAIMM_09376 [Cladophialophora immunda]